MDFKEAYRKLIRKNPDMIAGAYAEWKDLYLFALFPRNKKLSADELEFYDNSWSVNKKTGEMKPFGLMLPENAHILFEIEPIEFDDADVLKTTTLKEAV